MTTVYELSGSNYSEVDASNSNSGPAGWAVGQAPSNVGAAGRAFMGSVKRSYDRDHAGSWCTVGGTANAVTLTYTTAPTAYVQGEKYAFLATAANTGATTVNVNSLGAKNAYKKTSSGVAACVGGEIQIGDIVELEYDGTQFQMLSVAAAVSLGANTFTATQTIQDTTPRLILDSSSIGGSDAGDVTFSGLNSSSADKNWGNINAQVTDSTAGSETAQLNFQTNQAGSFTTRMSLANGLTLGGPTGGDKGAGTVNATGLYVGGAAVVTSVARANVRFTGSTGAIVGTAVNVSSVTRTSAGLYTINFTSALPDANYVFQVSALNAATGTSALWMEVVSTAAGSITVQSIRQTGAQDTDPTSVCVTIF
jgi:hypothetical protein